MSTEAWRQVVWWYLRMQEMERVAALEPRRGWSYVVKEWMRGGGMECLVVNSAMNCGLNSFSK